MSGETPIKELTSDERHELVAKRSVVRRNITMCQKRFDQGTQQDYNINRQVVLNLATEMNKLDDLIQDDSSKEYDLHIKFMLDCIKADQAELNAKQVESEEAANRAALKAQLEASTRASEEQIKNMSQVIIKQQTTQASLEKFSGAPSHYRQWERLFELSIEKNQAYELADQFRIFKQLVGSEAAEMIATLDPDAAGLATAKMRIRTYYSDPYRVREDVYHQVQKVPLLTVKTPISTLRKAINTFEGGLKALRDSNSGDLYINSTFYRLVASKISTQLYKSYLRSHPNKEAETLIKFVTTEIELQITSAEDQGLTMSLSTTTTIKPKAHVTTVSPVRNSARTSPHPFVCGICDGPHRTIYCKSNDCKVRKDIATRRGLCLRCLRPNHQTSACTSTFTCYCGEPHSSVVCQMPPRPRAPIGSHIAAQGGPVTEPPNSNQTCPKTLATVHARPVSTNASHPTMPETSSLKYADPCITTYLQTILVDINGCPTRVLLDSGASRSVVSEELANSLGLQDYASHRLTLGGYGGQRTKISKRLVNATLTSQLNKATFDVVLSVVPQFNYMRIATIPSKTRDWLLSLGYDVCDSDGDQHPIQIIIGMEFYHQLWLGSAVRITNDLYARKSIFGWIVSGVASEKPSEATTFLNFISSEPDSFHQHSDVPWSHASRPTKARTPIEEEYLQGFIASKVRHHDGQYYVRLPWLSPVDMASNRDIAYKRFKRLDRSLEHRQLTKPYSVAIQEMIVNYAELAPATSQSNNVYYMPHHCVCRLDKSTTQIRIVFDGSSHDTGTKSLNDNLYKGTNTWDSYTLFLKFRMGNTAVIADVEKAFLRIAIEPEDRDALRFWWFDEHGNPTIYRFKAVPFGTSASPFLLYAVLQHHLAICSKQYPEVVQLIANNFYVDDLLLAIWDPTEEYLEQLNHQVTDLFKLASMNIRKWRTNITALDQKWSPDADNFVKVLGHYWNTHNDTLSLSINIDQFLHPSLLTKRQFSSFVSSVYDPMGFVSPFMVQLRIFLRRLWTVKLDWDDPIPQECFDEALSLIKDATLVNTATLPRNAFSKSAEAHLVLFCDASKLAVGVAYCSDKPPDAKDINMHLLMSRAKLARDTTIPDLELDGMVMAAKIAHHLLELHPFKSVTICSDSLPNLQRLMKHPNCQKPVIALRINQVKKLVKAQFRHVKTDENIADIVSRGCAMKKLLANKQWWNGPQINPITRFNEVAVQQIIALPTLPSECPCRKFPNYKIAFNVYRKAGQFITSFSRFKQLAEVDIGLALMIQHSQRHHFSCEIKNLEEGLPIDRESILRNYKCFIDSRNTLRLRTRLLGGTILTDDQVCPIILPYKCHLSDLIIMQAHSHITLHSGLDRTMTTVRDRYYILGLKRMAQRIVKQCAFCKRKRAITLSADHGSIPEFRIDASEPAFTNVGVDIFGPLRINMIKPGKRYGLILTCATTRAVHLEILNNMTTEQVFLALRRFFARRGIPKLIYSDNGPQLRAAQTRLQEFIKQISLSHPELELRLKWINLTASAPWRGGFYERLIRTVKEALLAITFRRTINDDELITIIVEAEARLNDRPLFTSNGEAVTPSHFFRGKKLTQLPPIGNNLARELTRDGIIDEYLKSLRSLNSRMCQWRAQYLLQLRNFHQNVYCADTPNRLQVGDVVILHSSAPMHSWPLGIIRSLHPSQDGIVRTFDVETIDRGRQVTKVRDLRTLIPLECAFETPPPTPSPLDDRQ